jgi:mono/diheme cytochrome c family protein
MRVKAFFLLLFVSFPLFSHAQQSDAANSAKLNDREKRGQLVFQQRCSICHSMLSITDRKTYAPFLYRDMVDGNEDFIRKAISDGQDRLMPGFKYGLTTSEINDVIEFLKTVKKPA